VFIITEEEYIEHYGTPRHSGRYPWGSGGNEVNTRNPVTLDSIQDLKRQGLSEKEIAEGFGMTIAELRQENSIARSAKRASDIAMAQRLQDKGASTNAIAKRMGIPEPTARNLLKPGAADRANVIASTAASLKSQVDNYGMLDVGKGVENYMGVTSTRLNTALRALQKEGYVVHPVNTRQVATGKDTRTKVLAKPGVTQKEVWENQDKIRYPNEYSDDGGRTYSKPQPPLSINPKRVDVIYGSQGGREADGTIYARPGVKDVSLGGGQYAQVRIQVGDGHYLKGMAVYKDGLPDGIDLQFNTAKADTGNKLDAMKPLKDDPDLPFGSIVRQIHDKPGSPDSKVSSVMNIVNEEGDWEKWSRSLSSQMLSKQSPKLAKEQLDMTYERREYNHKAINELTNSTVRKKLLLDFAGATDSEAVHLQAAAMPGQAVKVLLPVSSLKPSEVYTGGTFKDGEIVVLIRHPHGGTFEIPQLVVNNKNAEARRLLGTNAKTAIGINHEVAKRLSGADFDGDTVLIIPNRQGRITTTSPLEGLKDFDPVASYPGYPGMKVMGNTDTQMGEISNLITDMTIKGASHDEIARAVKHSMVVIDAEKKELNYKLSYNDNNIKQLKEKYLRQPSGKGGAATLISRSRSKEWVPERKPRPQSEGGPIDKKTGELVYVPTNRPNWKTGAPRQTKVTRLGEATDAFTLSSGTPIEGLYATHSNKLKALANRARLDAIKTPPSKYSPSANKTYSKEVASLDSKLALAQSNAPLERRAQRSANATIKLKKSFNPEMDKDTYTKVKYQALEEARRRVGASKHKIAISNDEWDAIQAGAISDSKLSQILTHADMDRVRELATPKTQILMTANMKNRATSMYELGFTRAEVAAQLGVSLSTLDAAVSVGNKGDS
jgi:hypothetical protein